MREIRRTAGLCAGDLPRLCLSGDAFRLLLLAERGRFLRPGVGESDPCEEQNIRVSGKKQAGRGSPVRVRHGHGRSSTHSHPAIGIHT